MALKFYQNYMNTDMAQSPNDTYKELLQASIDDQWDNITQVVSVLEQDRIGGTCWNPLDVRVDYAIEMGTGFKQDDDFKIFAFRNIEHKAPKGLLYQYDDDYWIVINTGELGSITSEVTVRRCNNVLRWRDRYNGYVYEYPCVIEYVLESPQQLKDKEVITANGHISVICQGDEISRNFEKNSRFIFNGQPYKLTAYQNMLNESIKSNLASNLIYLDMYLDMEEPDDCFNLNIANYHAYQYDIEILNLIKEQVAGYRGQIQAVVKHNGTIVDRGIEYCGNHNVTIDKDNGIFTITGEIGHKAYIEASISGNPQACASMTIDIVEQVSDTYSIDVSPQFNELRVGKTIVFSVIPYLNGVRQSDESVTVEASGIDEGMYELRKLDIPNQYALEAKAISVEPLTLTCKYKDFEQSLQVMLTSMF